jgi:hypothetical protein
MRIAYGDTKANLIGPLFSDPFPKGFITAIKLNIGERSF